MSYNFDEPALRTGKNSIKWDVKEGELPMWIADMDFKTAPPITAALQNRLNDGAFGYEGVSDEWYNAIIRWYKTRHSFKIEKEWLMFCTGVLAAISAIVKKLTTPAENVLMLTPIYNNFYNSVLNAGRNVKECPLAYSDGKYLIDWAKLEEGLSDEQTSLMIFCNPHNPIGKIWDRETMIKIGELAKKYGVTVVSDEIHCDITDPSAEYIPFASASDICRDISVTCIAPTKTFNIAGLMTSAIFVPNKFLRHKVWREINTDEVAEPSTFAVPAAIAAYNECGDWLDELKEYLYKNKQIAREYLADSPIKMVEGEATYLLWLDCGDFTDSAADFADFLRADTGLYLSSGNIFGTGGEKFLRMNIACPAVRLKDGLSRLQKGVRDYISQKIR